jgi:hypothetical protein
MPDMLVYISITLNNYFGDYIFINRKLYSKHVYKHKYIFLLLHIITEFVLLKAYDKFIITKIKAFKFKP